MFMICELQPPKYQSLQVQAKTQNSDHFGGRNFRLSGRSSVFLAWTCRLWYFGDCNSQKTNIEAVIRKSAKLWGCNSQIILNSKIPNIALYPIYDIWKYLQSCWYDTIRPCFCTMAQKHLATKITSGTLLKTKDDVSKLLFKWQIIQENTARKRVEDLLST